MRPDRANERPPDLPETVDRVAEIDRLLPQIQCRRCGYTGCRPYAEAIAGGHAPINRCPPGGTATLTALARLLDTAVIPLDPDCGVTPARSVAAVDNSRCIGCTKCILACPVDAIVGAPRHQHHVLADRCTGCELCLPPCPVDCIEMKPLGQSWSPVDADRGRSHHRARLERLASRAQRQSPRIEPLSDQAASAKMPREPREPGLQAGQAARDALSARDPLVALGAPAERARRLAQILARVNKAERQ